MCACDAHWDTNAHCSCTCPEHEGRREYYARYLSRHRADVPVDSCIDLPDRACVVCIEFPPNADGKHRAEVS